MNSFLKCIGKFVISMILTTIACTYIWGVAADSLYDCTDPGAFDYWSPGDWVHGHVVTVAHVVHTNSMNEPDTIKQGWSVKSLWRLWWTFVIGSFVISFVAACVPWTVKQRRVET